MIQYITGRLEQVEDGELTLAVGGIGLQVLATVWTCHRLAGKIGETIRLYTIAYWQSAGMNLLQPVLIGFEHEYERRFFNLLTTVDRLGPRMVLRMLTKPVDQVAAAIEAGDAAFLQQLPGIGRQKSGEIIAKLRGKVAPFVNSTHRSISAVHGPGQVAAPLRIHDYAEAPAVLDVLIQLGYSARESERMLEAALRRHGAVEPETLIRDILAGIGAVRKLAP